MPIYKYNSQTATSHNTPTPQRPSVSPYGKRRRASRSVVGPRADSLSLPLPLLSDEVWTGMEYQVASHMMMLEGIVEKSAGNCRASPATATTDGSRNPFNEYECGHWYARAMSSYGLIQGLTGVRYDAVDKTLYIDSRVGDNFRSFLSTATGFGTVSLKNGKPSSTSRWARSRSSRWWSPERPAPWRNNKWQTNVESVS